MARTLRTQAGLTLLELMIATAIGALVLAALNSIVSLGLRAQAEGGPANELLYQGQFALERMVDKARSVLPSEVVIAATPSVSTTCGGVGAPVAVAGGSSVTLPAGRTIPANGSCTLTVSVIAAGGGSHTSTLLDRALVTSNGNNAARAAATLTVVPPGPAFPTLGQSFSPASINAGGVSTLTVTLSNPNVSVATLNASLVDTLPSGVVIAATPTVGTTCSGAGAPVAVAGTSIVTLPAGRSIPANGSCTLTVNVTAAGGGSYHNTLLAGALVTSNGNNAATAVVTLTVIATSPTIGNAFGPTVINAGGVSTLTVTLTNPSSSVATLTASFVDSLPGVVIAPTPAVSTTCGGAGAPVAVAGTTTVTLPAGRSIPANSSCVLTVNVTAAFGGSYTDSLFAGNLVTSSGNNAATAVATLTVVPGVASWPRLGVAFSPATINAGGVSTLTVTLRNPDASVATLTASLIGTFPSGLVIAPTPAVSTTCSGAGAPVAVAGGSTVTLPAGRSIPANGSCVLTVNVTAPAGGYYDMPVDDLVTSNGNNPDPAKVTLIVISTGPTLAKAFSPASINAGGGSTLIVTLSNPSASVATLTAPLTDTLPRVMAATPAAGTTGNWFSPVMYCRNASDPNNPTLIETTTADTTCSGTTVIANNVTLFLAQPAACVGAACVKFCRNASNQLIKTVTTDTACTGTTVIASNLTWSFAQPSGAGPVDKPVGVLFLLLTHSTAAQPVWLTTSVRLGGGTL